MQKARQISLFTTLLFWGILIGGIGYSHMVYMPAYLSHLPESNRLITGESGLQEQYFWMTLHPLLIVTTLVALILNWKNNFRRKFIGIAFIIYAVALVVTAIYFVPELLAFAAADPSVPLAEWQERGNTWEKLSWVRGAFLYAAFFLMLIALSKPAVSEVYTKRTALA